MTLGPHPHRDDESDLEQSEPAGWSVIDPAGPELQPHESGMELPNWAGARDIADEQEPTAPFVWAEEERETEPSEPTAAAVLSFAQRMHAWSPTSPPEELDPEPEFELEPEALFEPELLLEPEPVLEPEALFEPEPLLEADELLEPEPEPEPEPLRAFAVEPPNAPESLVTAALVIPPVPFAPIAPIAPIAISPPLTTVTAARPDLVRPGVPDTQTIATRMRAATVLVIVIVMAGGALATAVGVAVAIVAFALRRTVGG